DRTGTLSKVLSFIAQLPADSPLTKRLNNAVIQLLFNTIPSPPVTLLGPKYRYRHADGGLNNPFNPDLGRAGGAYARSVSSRQSLSPYGLPAASLVFDELLRAPSKRENHPGGNSALTFAFASLVTHSLFRTDTDWNTNKTSSYLDLSPLYGSNQEEQDAVRVKDGRGLLHPDCFAESRLTLLPPAASALLVIWSRNHNYIATNLLKINERQKWTDPPPLEANPTQFKAGSAPPKADPRMQQDDEIFQTARLINCGSFMSVIMGDYVAGFLGLGRDGITWSMQPFDPITTDNGFPVSRGQGNQVSVEFNLLYRWHAVSSEKDQEWTEGLFNELFVGKPFDEIEIEDFKSAIRELHSGKLPAKADPKLVIERDPRKREFGGLKRGADHRFSDAGIANILQDATESAAKRYGARGVPPVFRIIEMMGIEQARQWGVCSMNEFRRFLGLKPFATFDEWNRDPKIAEAARRLYGTIDRLELYPGLHAEETMTLGPGSGLCSGYTITRGILSDAIALVRGDRFYTTDFTPANLTAWGFQDVARDINNGAFGAYLPKLLMRTLPRHYPYNSAYSLFPFFTPSVTQQNLAKLNIAENYSFARPRETPVPKPLNTFTAIRQVSSDINKFKVIYDPELRYLTRNAGMFLGFDVNPQHKDDRAFTMHALFPSAQTVLEHVAFYRDTTARLIASRSYRYDSIPGNHLDVIHDVINVVAIRWSCEALCGITPTTSSTSADAITEQQAYEMLTTLFECVFRNTEPHLVRSWSLRRRARLASDKFTKVIEGNIQQLKAGGDLVKVSPLCKEWLKKLISSGRPTNDLVGIVIGLLVGSSVNYAQGVAHTVDFYLRKDRTTERKHIVELCTGNDPNSKKLLVGYYREAARLNPQFPALMRISAVQTSIDQGSGRPPIAVFPGDPLFCSYTNAHLNPDEFPNPRQVDPSRPKESYSIHGAGTHSCPGLDFSEGTIPEIMKAVFSLKNLRRASGLRGALTSFKNNVLGTDSKVYVNEQGIISPWPTSLVVVVSLIQPSPSAYSLTANAQYD
ncbi:heme peroxidase, partial [Ceratobasidium sp. AG-I]